MRNRYRLSRDYRRLRALLDEGVLIVCFADHKADGILYRDVCQAWYSQRRKPAFSRYVFMARGIEYCGWNPSVSQVSFEEMMERHGIEFIDPDD